MSSQALAASTAAYRSAPPEGGIFAPRRFDALTGLRALAAYLVYLHHYPFLPFAQGHFASVVLSQGYLGVSAFYVLSGFLIFYNYADRVVLDFRWLCGYLRNRFARIYPLYFVVLCTTRWWSKPGSITDWLCDLTLIKGLHAARFFDGVPQAWSLTVEETFYLSFPFTALLCRRTRFGVAYACGATLLAGWALACTGATGRFYGFFGAPMFVANYTYFGRAFEFSAGMALAQWVRRHATSGRSHPNAGVFAWCSWAGLFGCAGCLVLSALIAERPPAVAFALHRPTGMAVESFVFPLAMVLLLFGLIAEDSLLRRMLEHRAALFLGRASYAFYLIQIGPLVAWLAACNVHARVAPVTTFAVLLAASCLLYVVIERPAHRLLRMRPANPPTRRRPHAVAFAGPLR